MLFPYQTQNQIDTIRKYKEMSKNSVISFYGKKKRKMSIAQFQKKETK